MATVAELNKKFYSAIEDAIGCKGYNKQRAANGQTEWVRSGAPPGAPPLPAHRVKLAELYQADRKRIEELTKKYSEARNEIISLSKKTAFDSDAVEEIKGLLDDRQGDFERHLGRIHKEQYDNFDLALENSDHFNPGQRQALLTQLKNAQKEQLEGVAERVEYDAQRLDKLANFDQERDQKFSLHILDLAEKKQKAIIQHYRPPGAELFSMLRAKIPGASPQPKNFGVIGEVELKRAEKFSVENVRRDEETGQWTSLGARKDKEKEAEEWAAFDTDYLRGRTEIRLEDVPTAGVFKQSLPVTLWAALGVIQKPELVIRLNATVEKNKENDEKGIPPTDSAVLCSIPATTSRAERVVILNILAHTYRAKGWQGVDMGYDTPKELWEEAYLACRRAGFADNQLFFKGKPANQMFDKKVLAAGKDARDRVEEVYQAKKDRPSAQEVEDAIERLAVRIPYPDANLNPKKFFDLSQGDQTRLFDQASLSQRAAIMGDYAFVEGNLAAYMQTVTAGEKAEILERIASPDEDGSPGNPDRAFDAFLTINSGDQPEVFKTLRGETAAYLLTRLPEGHGNNLFAGVPLEKKMEILSEPGLRDSRIYSLFQQLSPTKKQGEDENERRRALKEMAQDPESNAKALGAIVAQSFLSGDPDERRRSIPRLAYILKNLPMKPKDAAENIVAAVYEALPSDLRVSGEFKSEGIALQKMGQLPQEDFLTALQNQRGLQGVSPRAIQKLYQAAHAKYSGEEKFSDNEIDRHKDNLSIPGQDDRKEAAADFFYEKISSLEAANALKQSTPGDLAKQLKSLVSLSSDDKEAAKVVQIAMELGPNIIGKTLANFDDHENIKDLVSSIQEEAARKPIAERDQYYKFLANVQSVYYNETKGSYFPLKNLHSILAHTNSPKLIASMLKKHNGGELVNILNSIPDNAQQAKIFKCLSAPQQEEVFGVYFEARNFKQQAAFFEHLKPKAQGEYIDRLIEGLKNPQLTQQVADQFIACWSNPHLSPEQRGTFSAEIAGPTVSEILKNNTKPTASFLNHCFIRFEGEEEGYAFRKILEDTNIGQQPNRFNATPDPQKAQETYLNTVGEALALFSVRYREEAKDLFVNGFQKTDASDDDVASIRASALIHLASEGGKTTARSLFEDTRLSQQEKDEVKQKIVHFAGRCSPLFQKELDKLIDYERPPAAQPAPAQQPPPSART